MKKLLVLPLLLLFVGFTSCSDDDSKDEDDEPVVEEGEILSYEDVELKLADSDSDEYGIAFSLTTGETYKASEITVDNISKIDLVSFTLQAFIAFDSPDANDATKEIEGAKSTKIQMTNVEMTTEVFDSIEDDTLLKDLTVVNDEESQPISYRGVIHFETAEGKIGALKINGLNADRILFDVKVMK